MNESAANKFTNINNKFTQLGYASLIATLFTNFWVQAQNSSETKELQRQSWLINHKDPMPAYLSPEIKKICVEKGKYNRKFDSSIPQGIPVEVYAIIGEGDTAIAQVMHPALDAHKQGGEGGFLYIPCIAGSFHKTLDNVDVYKYNRVSQAKFSKNIRAYKNAKYLRGGNLSVKEMDKGFPLLEKLSPHDSTNIAQWWVDCSWLYSSALITNTLIDTLQWSKVQENPTLLQQLLPSGRNTSELIAEHENIKIYRKSYEQIAESLQIGDYMIRKWHMMVVIENTQGTLVRAESRWEKGYQETDLIEGLQKEATNQWLQKIYVNKENYKKFYKKYLRQEKRYQNAKKTFTQKQEDYKTKLATETTVEKWKGKTKYLENKRKLPVLINRTYSKNK